ncbi:uncharacterized protein EDB93DRAFT_1161140 [Suillus bovinus]|uniref:uncharacterized protein n=1 Tax=Suillus bovinus TaxID=48563 RepID=UPI001B86B42B|nr:uncharacterized protein EDB93DRAFT_1161140 [Suillus bovinus]KAG2140941.1 hypothetical protein EDB93DRAFT_1161140 [Suillus bovinus]
MLDLFSSQVNKEDLAEHPLPEALRPTSLALRVLCFLALGRPDFDDHWTSLQSERGFETVRTRLCSGLTSTFITASILAVSGVFISTASPVPYFGNPSPVSYCLDFISLMLAMIVMLTSGSSIISRLHSDRHWIQEQLKRGSYFVLFYLLSIVTPEFFVLCSLNCFIFSMLITGFSSQIMTCRAVTAFCLVAYVIRIGMILRRAMRRYATLDSGSPLRL